MDFARSFINNGQTSTSALPFNIQLPRFDLNSISETLSHTNFMPPNFDSFMGNSSRQSSREEGCTGCGNRFNFLKRKVCYANICHDDNAIDSFGFAYFCYRKSVLIANRIFAVHV